MTFTYEVEVTVFGPGGGKRNVKTELLEQVPPLADSIPPTGGVIFVAALTPGVDHGNFYLFRNETGLAHVMLHEHREHFAHDPQVHIPSAEVTFRDQSGEPFTVPKAEVTTWERGKAALLHWLPTQAHWPEFNWT